MEQTQNQPVTSSRLSVVKTVLKKAGMMADSDDLSTNLMSPPSHTLWIDQLPQGPFLVAEMP